METGALVASKLPILQSDSEQLTAMQTRWASILGPVISNPLVNGAVLKQIELSTGNNVINHRLGRKLQGWLITDQDAASDIYRVPNSTPTLTLTLNSSAQATVDIYVF